MSNIRHDFTNRMLSYVIPIERTSLRYRADDVSVLYFTYNAIKQALVLCLNDIGNI